MKGMSSVRSLDPLQRPSQHTRQVVYILPFVATLDTTVKDRRLCRPNLEVSGKIIGVRLLLQSSVTCRRVLAQLLAGIQFTESLRVLPASRWDASASGQDISVLRQFPGGSVTSPRHPNLRDAHKSFVVFVTRFAQFRRSYHRRKA